MLIFVLRMYIRFVFATQLLVPTNFCVEKNKKKVAACLSFFLYLCKGRTDVFLKFRILANSSELWKKICRTAKVNGQLGDTLVLRCENHPDQEIKITTAKVRDPTDTGCCLHQRP